MARAHYWQYVLNVSGSPVEGATVSLTLMPDITDVVFYTTQSDATTATSVETDENGRFDLWIGDLDETVGYATNSTFALNVSGDTIDPISIEDVHIPFPNVPRMVVFDILPDEWTLVSGTSYVASITHELNSFYPMIIPYLNVNGVRSTISTFTFEPTSVDGGDLTVDVGGDLTTEDTGIVWASMISIQEGIV